jgi:protein phosphatase
MRGNHEGPTDLMPSPHDLPDQFESKFKQKGAEAYADTRELFEHLYNAFIVDQRYLMLHGGLPEEVSSIDDLAFAHVTHPRTRSLEEILWSDPDDAIEETFISPRGAGQLFGKKMTDRVLAKLTVNMLIRGHESCPEGFKINHDGKVLTLFSCRSFPYFNDLGAYLDVNLETQVTEARELTPYIHQF